MGTLSTTLGSLWQSRQKKAKSGLPKRAFGPPTDLYSTSFGLTRPGKISKIIGTHTPPQSPTAHSLNNVISWVKMFAVYPPIATSEARFLAASTRGSKKSKAAVETYDCKHCNRSFNKQYNLLIHERSHEKNENQTLFGCNICGKAFKNMNNMKNHRLSHSPAPIPKQLKGFLVECVTY